MSLIADSLKKAVKEKSTPKWEADRENNPVGNREPLTRPGLSTVFRVLLLVLLPAAILIYLISIGAFSFKKTPVAQKPDLPVSIPQEEARVSPPLKPASDASPEKPVVVFPSKPLKKAAVAEETVPKKKAVVAKATAALKPSDKPLARKKEKAVARTVVPSSPPKKKSKKIKKPVKPSIDAPKEKAVAVSSSGLKPASPVVPNIPPVVVEKKILMVPPAKPAEKPVFEKKPDIERKAVVPEDTSTPEPSEVEIPQQKIAALSESSAKAAVESDPVQAPASAKQKTASAVVEKITPVVPPAKPADKPVLEKKPDVEKKAVVSEDTSTPEPLEVVAIPEKKVIAKPEPPAKLPLEPILEKAPVSAKGPGEINEKPDNLTIEVQKKNPEVASLPSSSAQPKISRSDPAGQDNVFNNSDYYFNRGIFFQQARDWQKALVNYSKSEELDPNNPDTYNNKGVVLKEMGKYDQALDEFLRAVFLDARYAKAYNNIGVVYYMQKNYSEAVRNYLKAIDINPTNLEAFNNLAIIYKKQKAMDKARGVLNRALSLDPDHPGTNYNLAVLYEESSEIKPALHFYRRFIELGAISYPSLVIQVKEHLEVMTPQ